MKEERAFVFQTLPRLLRLLRLRLPPFLLFSFDFPHRAGATARPACDAAARVTPASTDARHVPCTLSIDECRSDVDVDVGSRAPWRRRRRRRRLLQRLRRRDRVRPAAPGRARGSRPPCAARPPSFDLSWTCLRLTAARHARPKFSAAAALVRLPSARRRTVGWRLSIKLIVRAIIVCCRGTGSVSVC